MQKERRFKITTHGRLVTNYRWTRSTGLQCELFANVWNKSDYTLPEFLSGMNGHFIEL